MKQLLLFFTLAGSASLAFNGAPKEAPSQQGILFLDHSWNVRLRPVPISAVRLNEGFWTIRRRVTTERGLPLMLQLLEDHGVVDNFRRVSGRKNVARRGRVSTDSDLYKWIEAAAWAIASNETSETDRQKFKVDIEALASDIIAAQDRSGYLNTFYVADKADLRFSELTRSHEDYCLGHLIQAAIAYYRATGSRLLLDPAIRFADYVVANFGPTKRPFVTGHPELEMALMELYRTTGETRYLDFTRYLFSGAERERMKLKDLDISYMFSGKAFTSRTVFEGHAVRALYAASGATDYQMEAGDPAFKRTLDLLWTDLTSRKMYITGGVGSRSVGESFGDPYELPNADAYAETCAAIANVMWNFRLLVLTGDANYADVLERALYNGANSAMSSSGTLYCYRNPLASGGEKLRNPWYSVDCCPPNLERLFESLPGYLYATSRDGIFVNLYHASELNWHLQDSRPIHLTQDTSYPWNGDVKLTVGLKQPTNFALHLRWPAWAPDAQLSVNGQVMPLADSKPGSYIQVTRTWRDGDVVAVSLAMQPVQVAANPHVRDDYGRLALERGPLVYALEEMDQSGASLDDLFLRPNGPMAAEQKKDLLGGVTVLKVSGQIAEKSLGSEPLYQSAVVASGRAKRPVILTFIPYYAINNREPTPMEVWVPVAGNGGKGPAFDNRALSPWP